MNFGESELIYERYDVRLLKIGCRKIVYHTVLSAMVQLDITKITMML